MVSTNCELEDTTPPDIPPRSRLYHLEPAGVGTPYVESFTGYVARLAKKYSTTLFHLFSKEVAPVINKPGTISLQVYFAQFAKATNGLGVTAFDLVNVLEKLTLRNDLRFTTMLPWSGLISSKSLTRQHRSWCPSCYEEYVTNGNEVYDQLLWALQSVRVCTKHMRRLEDECPYCGKWQWHLSHRVRPGFCGRCQSWLGYWPNGEPQAMPSKSEEAIEEELRIAAEVGKMLATAPSLELAEMIENFQKRLRTSAGKLFRGRGVPSRHELPIDKQAINCWLRGTQTPSLPLLLKTCLALRLSPVTLFTYNSDDGPRQIASTDKGGGSLKTRNDDSRTIALPVNWKDVESLDYVERRLKTALDEYPPPSLTKISKELKCAKGTLRKKFPNLTAQIASRALVYYRPYIDPERMLEILRAALKESPPPPLEEISRRLSAGASATTLHKWFPRESRKIVERYSAYNKRRLDDAAMEKQLRAVLKRVPPPPMSAVALKLGVASPTLYSKFPKLYKAASNRSAAYISGRNEQNRRALKAEIKSICKSILQEGIYPSYALVRSRLSMPCQSAIFSKTRRAVLAELSGNVSL